jgi:4-amino-4-deoxy-L-arabinose transferase-like glycosyltransferase
VRSAVLLACLALALAAWGRPVAMGLALPVVGLGLLFGDRRRLGERLASPWVWGLLAALCAAELGTRWLDVEHGLLASYSAPNSPPEGERSVAYRELEHATRIDRVLDFDEERFGPFARRFPLSFLNRRLHSVRGNRAWRAVELTDPAARDSFLPSPRVRPEFEARWRGFFVPAATGLHFVHAEGGRVRLQVGEEPAARGGSATVEVVCESGVPVPLDVRTAQDAKRPTRFALTVGTSPEAQSVVSAEQLFPNEPTPGDAARARWAGRLRAVLLPCELALLAVVLASLFDPRRLNALQRGFLGVFSIALVPRLALHLAYFAQPHSGILQSFLNDDWIHMGKAWDLIHKDPLMPPRAYYWAPLYRYFLVAVQMLVGESFRSIVLVQQVLGALTCALVFRAGARAFGVRAGLWAGCLCAFSPFLGYWETTTYIASFATFLAALALERMVALAERLTPRAALGAGLAIGVACLARPNLGLFLIFSCAVLALRVRPPVRGLGLAAVALASALLAIAPATIKNAYSGGGFVPLSTNGPVNLYIGNNPAADGTYAGPKGEFTSETYVDSVVEFVTNEPAAWLALEGKKLALLLGQKKLWFFYLGGLAGWIVAVGRRAELRWPVTAMASAVLVVPVAFFLDDRFLLPAVPPLALYSGLALDAGFARLGFAERVSSVGRRVAVGAALLVAATLYVWICTPAFEVLNRARAAWNLGAVADWLPYLL